MQKTNTFSKYKINRIEIDTAEVEEKAKIIFKNH